MTRPKTSAAQLRAVQKYQRENVRQYVVKLHRTHDAELVELLEKADSKAGLIKDALRAYAARVGE